MPKTGSKQLACLFKTMCGSNFSPVFPTASVESLGKYLNMWATPDEEFIVAPRQIRGSVLVDSRAAAVARVTLTKVLPFSPSPPPPLISMFFCWVGFLIFPCLDCPDLRFSSEGDGWGSQSPFARSRPVPPTLSHDATNKRLILQTANM